MPPRRRLAKSDESQSTERREWYKSMQNNWNNDSKAEANDLDDSFHNDITLGSSDNIDDGISIETSHDVKGGENSPTANGFPSGNSIQISLPTFASFTLSLGEESFGRYCRSREAPLSNALEVAGNAVEALTRLDMLLPTKNISTIVFGHAIGALFAWEFCLELRERMHINVSHLIISECAAPQVITERNNDWMTEKKHKSDDGVLVSLMISMGLVPDSFAERRDLLESFLMNFRNDIRMFETYRFLRRRKLLCPLPCSVTTIRTANQDSLLLEDVGAWGQYTTGGVVQKLTLDPDDGRLFTLSGLSSTNEWRAIKAVIWGCLEAGKSSSLTSDVSLKSGVSRQDDDLSDDEKEHFFLRREDSFWPENDL